MLKFGRGPHTVIPEDSEGSRANAKLYLQHSETRGHFKACAGSYFTPKEESAEVHLRKLSVHPCVFSIGVHYDNPTTSLTPVAPAVVYRKMRSGQIVPENQSKSKIFITPHSKQHISIWVVFMVFQVPWRVKKKYLKNMTLSRHTVEQ